MMTEVRRSTDPDLLKGLPVVDLSQPVIIQKDGKPIMVLLSYEEYLRLKLLSGDRSVSAQ
jgi:hypothetical protein